jgi:hypothetical protein
VNAELITEMYEGHVFDAMLLEADMAYFHVPFDDLWGDGATEAALRDAVGRFERVALIGESCSGKTSVARYVLESPPPRILPIWVSLAYKEEGIATTPARFAENLVDVLSAYAVRTSSLTAEQREEALRGATPDIVLPGTSRRVGGSVGLKAWLLNGEVARDVTRTIEGGQVPRSEGDILQRANDVLEAIRAHSLEPVLVMDDTDRLIGRSKADTLIPRFYGSVLRVVVEQLRAGLVLAAQPFYLHHDEYKRYSRGIVERHLSVPVLPDAAAVREILTTRIHYVRPRATADDAFVAEAINELFQIYSRQQPPTIRALLTAAHSALTRAQTGRASMIDIEHVEAGADDALLS